MRTRRFCIVAEEFDSCDVEKTSSLRRKPTVEFRKLQNSGATGRLVRQCALGNASKHWQTSWPVAHVAALLRCQIHPYDFLVVTGEDALHGKGGV